MRILQEAANSCLIIKEFDEEIVQCMLEFMYGGDYGASTDEDDKGRPTCERVASGVSEGNIAHPPPTRC